MRAGADEGKEILRGELFTRKLLFGLVSIAHNLKVRLKGGGHPRIGSGGPHVVGTTKLILRSVGERTHSRTIVAQLWYPSDTISISNWKRAAAWLSKLRHPLWAPAHHGAPLSPALKQAPAIVYVPGSDHHDDNTFTLANLASHGFIVAALDNPFRRPSNDEPPYRDEASAGASVGYSNRCIARGVKTASLLVDALEQLNRDARQDNWHDRIDPSRVGILGYALGGVVAAQSTLTGRFAAAANLAGAASDNGPPLTSPYLLLLSDFSKGGSPEEGNIKKNGASLSFYRNAQRQAAQPRSHVIEIAGADDHHFRDGPANGSWPSSRGQVPNYNRIRSIIDSYTVAFFSTYLRGTPNPLMRVRHSPYPEVRFLSPSGAA